MKKLSNLELTYQREVDYLEPERYREILALQGKRKLIAQGAGLSYAAASFGEDCTTVNMRQFDRVISFDPIDKTIEVEAGITLKKLYEYLTPRGYYIAIQPGWPDLCVGSLIATNVHGKNQYVDGLFSDITENLKLFHPTRGIIHCSRVDNIELFELTCGGLGLTGIILSAKIKIRGLLNNSVTKESIPVGSISETVEVLTKLRDKYDVVMSWSDLSRPGRKFGSGFVVTSKFDGGSKGPMTFSHRPLDPHRHRIRIPVFNRLTIPFINRLYYFREIRQKHINGFPIANALFPFVGKGFYFDLYGNKGFIAQQIIIPEKAIVDFTREFENLVRVCRIPIVLAAFKAFRGTPHYLNFTGTGFSLYTDLINNADSIRFLDRYNDLATSFGCVTNIIRNNFLKATVVKAQYVQYEKFRENIRTFDPDRLFVSELSQRLEL